MFTVTTRKPTRKAVARPKSKTTTILVTNKPKTRDTAYECRLNGLIRIPYYTSSLYKWST